MALVNLYNLARMTVASSGTGTITLNAAVTGFLTFDLAGASTAAAGSVVRYGISDTANSELGSGTYTSSSLTLTRGSSTQGLKSTNSNSPINMSNAAHVFIAVGASDHPFLVDNGGATTTSTLGVRITATTASTSLTTGALVVTGGLATGSTLFAPNADISNATNGTGVVLNTNVRTRTGSDVVWQMQGTASANDFSLTAAGTMTVGGPVVLTSTAAGQIQFPATQVPSANVNTLDDYEEGTFTPSITWGGGSVGIAYTRQEGNYTKIGNRVHFTLRVTLNGKGSSTGNMSILGLPFTNAAIYSACAIWVTATNIGVGTNNVMALVDASAATISAAYLTGGDQVLLTDADFNGSGDIMISGSYSVA